MNYLRILISMLCTFILVHCFGGQTKAQDRSVRYKIASPLETQASFNNSPQKMSKPIMVAYMPPATEFNFYLDIGKGIRNVCSVTGDKSFMFAPQSDNPSEQMKMIEEVIRQKVDAIILSTHDPKSAASFVKKAVDQGIVVVIVNSDTPRFTTPVHAVVGYIQRAGTHKIGRYILEKLGGNEAVKVGVIEGAPGYHSTERVGGFLDAIKGTNFKLVSSLNGKWNTEGGNMAALKMFKAHPDISVVFAANDFEIIGAVSALKTLKINNVFLLGNDGDPAAFERIADGRITATVNTDPVLIGQVSMQVVLDSIRGKFKGGFVETPTVIVDKNNLNQYWTPPISVEGENFKEMSLVTEALPDLTNKDGSGLYLDILKEIYEPRGIKLKFKMFPYIRAEMMVKKKKADALLGAYRGEIDGVIYPQWYYSANIISVIYKKEKINQWKGQDSLAGKTVSWIRNYDYDRYLYVPVNKSEKSGRVGSLLMLKHDRIDFFLDNAFNLNRELKRSEKYLKSNDFDRTNYQIKELMRLKLYMAFAYTKKGAEFAKIFDDEFAQLLASGKLKQLFDKWEFTPFPFEQ